MLVNNTPVEVHSNSGVNILVKREDLCAPYPGPSFSKMRGVVAHIQNRPEGTIGVLDTFHSKAGWCVSYVCQQLGKKAINYWPRYKADLRDGLPRIQQQEAHLRGAHMVSMPAGRSAILYHGAKKHLKGYGEAYMMPNALKLPESITENAAEAVRTAPSLPPSGTLVISISSGTVAAGVLKGFKESGLFDTYDIVLHMGYSRSQEACRMYMEDACGFSLAKALFIDEGYGYADQVRALATPVPFPCNPYYDAKAWGWLTGHGQSLAARGPIVFWNIGA